jgi:hypothetical protein
MPLSEQERHMPDTEMSANPEDLARKYPTSYTKTPVGHESTTGETSRDVYGKKFFYILVDEIFKSEIEKTSFSFERCTLINCTFVGPMKIYFTSCRLIDCKFENGVGGDIPEAIPRITQNIWMVYCDMRRFELEKNSYFSGIKITDSSFSSTAFTDILFHNVEFGKIVLHETSGLSRCFQLEQVIVANDQVSYLNRQLQSIETSIVDKWASWDRLRTFGRLPLFGTSFSVLIVIPSLFWLLAEYNRQIDRIQRAVVAVPVPEHIKTLVSSLHPIQVPSLSLWILISTLLLAIASTLFTTFCPSRIKEYSPAQWEYQLRESMLPYLVDSWSNPLARIVAAPCYLLGAVGTVIILAIKLFNAGKFIIKNAGFW